MGFATLLRSLILLVQLCFACCFARLFFFATLLRLLLVDIGGGSF